MIIGRIIKTSLLYLFLFAIQLPLFAEQLSYSKQEQQGKLRFNYQWRDQFDIQRKIDISFDKKSLLNAFRNFRSYQPHIAQRYIYIELQKAAQQIDPRQARVKIRNMRQEIQISVQSRNPDLLSKWRKEIYQQQDLAMDRYLKQTYYSHYVSPLGERAVKPDHVRFAKESRELMLPVAQALYELMPEDLTGRSHTNLLLSWLQSIPYNTLENRITANGKGYAPPPQVIFNNQGDCDSKSVLMASIMRLLLPDINMVLILLPNHALLGIGMPKQGNDETIELDGISYTLAEPTGPALFKVGEISAQSRQYIASGQFRAEKI